MYRDMYALIRLNFVRVVNIACFVASICWLILLSTTLDPNFDDFKQYWQAAVNVYTTGNPFVALPEADRTPYLGYFYPPIFAYLIKPIGLLSQIQGQIAWFWLNSLLSIAFVFLCIKHSPSVLAKNIGGLSF